MTQSEIETVLDEITFRLSLLPLEAKLQILGRLPEAVYGNSPDIGGMSETDFIKAIRAAFALYREEGNRADARTDFHMWMENRCPPWIKSN
jgi:hypothetical protein